MKIEVARAPLEEILPLRDLYRQEMNCQIVHDSYHVRGFTDSYLLRVDGVTVGYGSVAGLGNEPRDQVKEFYVVPNHHRSADALFREFAVVSGARRIEVQTNDILLTILFFAHAGRVREEKILFCDSFTSRLSPFGATFGPVDDGNTGFEHTTVPVGDWKVDVDDCVVATGGLLFHYNPPYGDIYMEVAEPSRQRGYGSYLVQELKPVCREMGKVPAARCDVANATSRRTLEKAGMMPCARILSGVIAHR